MMGGMSAHGLRGRRFSASDVGRMVEQEILVEGERSELLGGELVASAAQGPVHAVLVQRLAAILERAAPVATHVRQQLPIEAGPFDRPEPDLCLTRGRVDDYLERHPGGADCLLVVQIAVTDAAEARRKRPMYALAGIDAYWIVDVSARRLLVHGRPAGATFGTVESLDESASVALPDGSTLPVAALLP
jgi:Uma2 family endonuclease